MIGAGATLALSGGSTFTQGASATFAPTINASAKTLGQLTAGGAAVSLDGELKVTTLGVPVINSSWPIITNARRSGEFSTLDFDGYNYDVQYPANGGTLIELPTPTPTATAAGTPTTPPTTPTQP